VSHFRGKKELTSVGVEFDDGGYIIRQKGNGVNGYELSTHEDPIDAVRTDLPEEVSSITRMGKINIQAQDEPYFMLRETPGTVAKELNKLVGLDIIDQTLTNLNKLENENKVKLNLLEKDSLEVKVNLKELDYLDKLKEDVIEVESLWFEYQQLIRKSDRIIELSESLNEVEGVIRETSAWLSVKTPVDELFQLIKEHAKLQSSHDKLKSTYDRITEAKIIRSRSDASLKSAVKSRDKLLNSTNYKKMFCKHCGAHSDHWRKE